MRISNDYSRAMSTLRYGLVRFEFDESIRKVLSALHPNYKFAFPNKKSIFRSKLQNKFHISINNIHFLWFIFSKRPKKLCKMLKQTLTLSKIFQTTQKYLNPLVPWRFKHMTHIISNTDDCEISKVVEKYFSRNENLKVLLNIHHYAAGLEQFHILMRLFSYHSAMLHFISSDISQIQK